MPSTGLRVIRFQTTSSLDSINPTTTNDWQTDFPPKKIKIKIKPEATGVGALHLVNKVAVFVEVKGGHRLWRVLEGG